MAKGESTPPEPAPSAQSTGVADQAQRFRDATEQIRQRTELSAKALGGLGLTIVSAVGIAKFADVFPFPPGQGWWVALLIASFLVMILAVGVFTYRLWHVSERILLRSDVDRMSDLKGDEENTVREVYSETARVDRAPSLRALEARAHRLSRIADRTADVELAAKLRQRANDAAADVRSAEARAGMLVVRRRAAQAIRHWLAIAAFLFLAFAIVGFGISADKLDSERTQLTKLVKDCAAAKKASYIGGVPRIPPICRGSSRTVSTPSQVPTAIQPSPSVTPAKGTTDRVQAASEAIRAAASIAEALAPVGGTAAVTADEGRQILHAFLTKVGFPFGSKVVNTLWDHFTGPRRPPLPVQSGQAQRSQPIELTLVLRDRRSPIQFIRVPNTPPSFVFGPRQRYQTIRLTVVVRDHRPRIQIIRAPVDSDG